MPYDSVITEASLSDAINRPEYSNEIYQAAIANSAVMSMAQRAPNMGTGVRKISVMDTLPLAYFVGSNRGSTGVPDAKQTTSMSWKGKDLTAEEIAVIVPIPEATLADASIDLAAQILPRIGEAMGRTMDAAVLGGANLPATWMDDTAGTSRGVLQGCLATGNYVVDTGDVYADVLGADGVFSLVEQDGYMVNGSLMAPSFMGRIRGTVGVDGHPIFVRALDGSYSLAGERVMVQRNGASRNTVPLISGDWSQIIWAVRQDVTVKLLTEGVIQDDEGVIVYNLAQQDMVALRVVFRVAVQIANPVTNDNTDEATRYPFACLATAVS
jgi:HK97 family phage major capsid protein